MGIASKRPLKSLVMSTESEALIVRIRDHPEGISPELRIMFMFSHFTYHHHMLSASLSSGRATFFWPSLDDGTHAPVFEAMEEALWHLGGSPKEILVDRARADLAAARARGRSGGRLYKMIAAKLWLVDVTSIITYNKYCNVRKDGC